MKVRLANTADHDHERVVRGFAQLLGRKPDAVATDFMELGITLLMMAAHDRRDAVAATVERVREADPVLMETARRVWAAGTQAEQEE